MGFTPFVGLSDLPCGQPRSQVPDGPGVAVPFPSGHEPRGAANSTRFRRSRCACIGRPLSSWPRTVARRSPLAREKPFLVLTSWHD